MAKKKTLHYPQFETPEGAAVHRGILAEYLVMLNLGDPLPIEWLADSLKKGVQQDIEKYRP